MKRLGQKIAGNLSEADFKGIVSMHAPEQVHAAACILQTRWQAAIEALGMSLPYSSSNPALSEDKQKECAAIGACDKIIARKRY